MGYIASSDPLNPAFILLDTLSRKPYLVKKCMSVSYNAACLRMWTDESEDEDAEICNEKDG